MDCYKILGLPIDCTYEEIREAYLTLLNKYHINIYSGREDEIKFRTIDAAYEILINPSKRHDYDQKLSKSHWVKDAEFNASPSQIVYNKTNLKKERERKLKKNLEKAHTDEYILSGKTNINCKEHVISEEEREMKRTMRELDIANAFWTAASILMRF